MTKGRIVQVMGPVVDVEFNSREELPFIKDALEVDNGGKRCVMEVAQHVGNNIARLDTIRQGKWICRQKQNRKQNQCAKTDNCHSQRHAEQCAVQRHIECWL